MYPNAPVKVDRDSRCSPPNRLCKICKHLCWTRVESTRMRARLLLWRRASHMSDSCAISPSTVPHFYHLLPPSSAFATSPVLVRRPGGCHQRGCMGSFVQRHKQLQLDGWRKSWREQSRIQCARGCKHILGMCKPAFAPERRSHRHPHESRSEHFRRIFRAERRKYFVGACQP